MDLTPEAFSIAMPGPIAGMGLAIERRLKFAFPETKFSHDFVPARLDAAAWDKLLRRTPFVGLGFAQMEPHGAAGRGFNGSAHWVVFLVTRNEAGAKSRFFGDKLAPGVLQMMQVGIAMLQGHTLCGEDGVRIGTIADLRAENSYAEDWKSDAAAMIALAFSVPISFGVTEALADVDVGLLDGASVTWSFDGTALIENPTGGV